MSVIQVVAVIVFVIGVASAVWIVRLTWVDHRRGETTWGSEEEFPDTRGGDGMNRHW